ncbi:MAG TPA: MFS transporter [Steroidobacteraceae bacterium]
MKRRALIVVYILGVWFVISFVTNIIGPLMPIIIRDFNLKLTLAGLLPFAFFLAYGVISIPAGSAVETYGARNTLLAAFALNLLGSLVIALLPVYGAVIGALFIIGLGMAMLQVVINPLMRTAGGEAHFAFFSVMGQLVFGLASFLSPLAFAWLMQPAAAAPAGVSSGPLAGALRALSPAALPWVSLYWGFAAMFLILIAITACMSIPQVRLSAEERTGTWMTYRRLLAERQVRLFFLGIVAYVGTEQSLANWMSQFLSTYHHASPIVEGAQAVSLFWGWMAVGCVLGLLLLKLLDSQLVLGVFCTLAIACVAVALYGSREAALWAFPAAGFFLSVMFSIVFSLALNSATQHHGALSGILCSGILGGALLPLLVGLLADWLGLRTAMAVVFVTLAYILSVAFWARPLVRNETVSLSRMLGLSKTS